MSKKLTDFFISNKEKSTLTKEQGTSESAPANISKGQFPLDRLTPHGVSVRFGASYALEVENVQLFQANWRRKYVNNYVICQISTNQKLSQKNNQCLFLRKKVIIMASSSNMSRNSDDIENDFINESQRIISEIRRNNYSNLLRMDSNVAAETNDNYIIYSNPASITQQQQETSHQAKTMLEGDDEEEESEMGEICDDEILIEEVKGYQILWNTKARGYKDDNKKNIA